MPHSFRRTGMAAEVGQTPGLRGTPPCRFSVPEETLTIEKAGQGTGCGPRGSAPPRCPPSRIENHAALAFRLLGRDFPKTLRHLLKQLSDVARTLGCSA